MTPQNQVTASLTADMPIVAAAPGRGAPQAQDNRHVAELGAAETRRQIALATADAYLSDHRAAARRRRERAGARRGEGALRSGHRARAAGHGQPAERAARAAAVVDRRGAGRGRRRSRSIARRRRSACCSSPTARSTRPTSRRSRCRPMRRAGGTARRCCARSARVPLGPEAVLRPGSRPPSGCVRDSSKDCWPSLDAIFLPQSIYPAQFFVPPNSWRFLLQASIPIFDSGQRAGAQGAAAGRARRGAGDPDRRR